MSVGEQFPKEQARILRCLENGFSIGPAGAFYRMQARLLLIKSFEAQASGDPVAVVRVFAEMQDFKS